MRALNSASAREGGIEGALIGLACAFFVLAGCQCDSRPQITMFLLLAWPAVMLTVATTGRTWLAAVYLLLFGVVLRLAILLGWGGVPPPELGSDVLTVTWQALRTTVNGGNPYTTTMGNGQPFTYPPGNLLYYLPAFLLGRIRIMEIVASAIVLAGLAWAAKLIRSAWPMAAMGIYAAAPPLVTLSTDNSNDTSAGALLFAGVFLMLLARRRSSGPLLLVSGAVMGWAVAFKQYLWVFWPLLALALASPPWRLRWESFGQRVREARGVPAWAAYAGAGAAVFLVLSLPFIALSPGGFLKSLWLGPSLWHGVGGWNVWNAGLEAFGWNAEGALRGGLRLINVIVMAAILIVGMRFGTRRPSHALLFGIGAWFAGAFLAHWTTYAYFAGIAPVVLLLPFADRLDECPEPRSGDDVAPRLPRPANG